VPAGQGGGTTHTHSFGQATCTTPATCSCGQTQGTALGHTTTNGTCTRCGATIGGVGGQEHTHSFGQATCLTPATCSCGQTQGAALGHTTTNGTCTRCGATIVGGQEHTHSFGQATCTTPATCSCGQTQGDALGHTTTNGTCTRCGATIGGGQGSETINLADIFAQYEDYNDWNFKLVFDVDASKADVAEEYAYTSIYFYEGYDCYYTDTTGEFRDYIIYTDDDILYYYDNGDGTHTLYSYNDNYDAFAECYYYIDWVDLAQLSTFSFTKNGDHYSATNASEAGNTIFGEYDDCVYTSFDIYIVDGKITKIVASQQDNYFDCTFTYSVELSNYNTVTVDVSGLNVSGGQGGDIGGGDIGGGDIGGDDDDDDDIGGGVTPPSSQDITVTFADSTNSTTLNSDGEIEFVANRAVDGWETDRGLQFQKQNGTVTLTSTTSVTGVSSITLDISANKTTDITITVKVGSTTFTCDGQSSVTFQNIKHNVLTFTSATAASGTIEITAVPAKTNESGLGSVYFKSITISATGTGGSVTPPSGGNNVMPEQSYNKNNH
ncbi:MAG: hypothetical protein J6Q55_01180, partial [Clostridia bacterium]|nr:hypothetical protein [Clostridia bacterium]